MIRSPIAWEYAVVRFLVIVLMSLGLRFHPEEPVRAQTDRSAVVSGTVINGTLGGDVPTGIEIELHVFSETGEAAIYTSTVASNAIFSFNNLPLEAGRQFVISASYQDVNYTFRSETLSDEGVSDVEFRIYETTNDSTDIFVEQAHFFLVSDAEHLLMAEVYSVSNSGDRTYVGEQTARTVPFTLSFTLPPEVANLDATSPDLEEHAVNEGSVLVHTQPIIPGNATAEISFSYERPYRDGMRVTRDLGIPIQSALVLLQGGDLEAVGATLSFNGVIETQMGNSASYLAGPLASDETLDFSITSQQSQSTREDAKPPLTPDMSKVRAWEILLGIGAVAVAGLATFALWEPAPISDVPKSLRPLLTEIAELDRAYASGEIEKADYRTKRAALTQTLKRNLDQSKN